MAQKLKRVFLVAISIFVLGFSSLTNAYAATPIYGYQNINGVGNVTVWLDYSSGVGYWQSYITNAANNWMYPGWSNPIYMNFVSNNYGSNMDFYLRNDAFWGGSMNVLAETRFFVNGGAQVYPWSSNWNYSEIYINHDVYSLPNVTNDMALGTTIHEMGHAFGLNHTTNVNSIMCQTGSGRVVQRVQQTDNDAINIIY